MFFQHLYVFKPFRRFPLFIAHQTPEPFVFKVFLLDVLLNDISPVKQLPANLTRNFVSKMRLSDVESQPGIRSQLFRTETALIFLFL